MIFVNPFHIKIEFKKEYLRLLYEEGKVPGKKYLFQPQLIKQYIKTVDILRNESNVEALYHYKGLHYEKKDCPRNQAKRFCPGYRHATINAQ
jgi:plasmid maintenance system killer protein